MATADTVLKTAHIHLEQATFRVYVEDADTLPIEEMEQSDTKPEWILWVGRSNDPTRNKTSILVCVTEGYDINELSDYLNSFD